MAAVIPTKDFDSDPRTSKDVLAGLEPYGFGKASPKSPLDANSTPIQDILEHQAEIEKLHQGVFSAVWSQVPTVSNVTTSTVACKGADDNDITLYIHKPTGCAESDAPKACIYYIHGGGMTVLTAADYLRHTEQFAAAGFIAVTVDFRNAAGANGPHPFPAGLNDCLSGLKWVHDNKQSLSISKIILCGESGGGNLSIATTMLAKQRGMLHCIDGVYAMCPYVSNAYHLDPADEEFKKLPSFVENNGMVFTVDTLAVLARCYDPDRKHERDPLAWPYWASAEDLAGLPPHVISVNELDPLCSEGEAFYRKLNAAGVRVRCRMLLGTPHAVEVICPASCKDVYQATLADIKCFVESL